MAEFDYVAVPRDVSYAVFRDLQLGRTSQQVVGRLIRFWDARDMQKDGEFMGIVVLFLDETCSLIHGFIPASLASQYRPVIREGFVFQLGSFEVARCTKLYKITDHPFLIRFLPMTTIAEVANVGPIELDKFMLRSHDQLKTLATTHFELPDVVGKIRFVHGPNLTDATCTQRLVVRLQINLYADVALSLWDDAASSFRAYLCSEGDANSEPSVMRSSAVSVPRTAITTHLR